MVRAPGRVTYVPVVRVGNTPWANTIENASAYGPGNIIRCLPLCDAPLKWCVNVVLVPRVRIKIYYYHIHGRHFDWPQETFVTCRLN